MVSVEQWDNFTFDDLYNNVLKEAKAILDNTPDGISFGTGALVEKLYPKSSAIYAKQESIRKVIYKALFWHGKRAMKLYTSREASNGRIYMGKEMRPWVWHKAKEPEHCPMCGQLVSSDGQ